MSFLHLGLVDADGAAAQFHAVDDDVVVLAAHFFRVAWPGGECPRATGAVKG